MFYEIRYETGRTSVANYADDAEALAALGEHHRRAIAGEYGGPLLQPAERIARVFVYDKHPNEFNPDQTMSADVLTKELADLVKKAADENGVVSVDQLAVAVRGLTHPMEAGKGSAEFKTIFKMKQKRELSLPFV